MSQNIFRKRRCIGFYLANGAATDTDFAAVGNFLRSGSVKGIVARRLFTQPHREDEARRNEAAFVINNPNIGISQD
jgi:hypothetical protein